MNVVMQRLLAVLVLVAPGLSYADRITLPAPTVLDCTKEPSPTIVGDKTDYKLTGSCDKVTLSGQQGTLTAEVIKNLVITGAKNTVTVDKVDKIAITGTQNRVTYKGGISGATPKTAATANNVVRQDAPRPDADDPFKEKTLPGATVGPAPAPIDCGKNGTQTVNSNQGTYEYRGTCALITVSGNKNILRVERATKIAITGAENIIDVDAAGTIAVSGKGNRATYGKGTSGAKPRVTNTGKKNIVEKRTPPPTE